ncbi:MAG TPA: alpha/beta hydrolase [Alphaproteobacteria bacterium]|nr:alpha/beta hydrolase [Alphaproteobacteria bacterium]
MRPAAAAGPPLWLWLRLVAVGALAFLTACMPRIEGAGPSIGTPALIETNPGFVFRASDGAELPARVWMATGDSAAADGPVLIALHGFNDYSHAFDAPAEWWAERGLTTYAFDQRGFGAAPVTGVWAGSATMVADLDGFVRAVEARHPGAPLYLVGVSMGGAVVLDALAGDGRGATILPVEGAVLVAPAVWGAETLNPFYRVSLWFGAHTFPWLKLSGRGLGIKPSDNIEMLRALGRDPLVIKETRIDTVHGMVALMDAAQDADAGFRVPLLVLVGAQDEVIPRRPTAVFLDRLDPAPLLAYYPDGYHMLLRDLQAETVWRDVHAWVTQPQAALPSGHEVRVLPLE